MRLRLVSAAAIAGLAAAVLPAHAAGAKPQITDAVGDANGVNQQFPGLGPEPPTVATAPADVAGADITSVQFTTHFITKKVKRKTVKVPNGFSVKLNLAAAPQSNVFYRVSAAAADCGNLFFELDNTPGIGVSDVRCPGSVPTQDVDYNLTGEIVGKSIVWEVPAGVFRVGTAFSSLNAQTRASLVAVVVPQLDYAASNATYVYGK